MLIHLSEESSQPFRSQIQDLTALTTQEAKTIPDVRVRRRVVGPVSGGTVSIPTHTGMGNWRTRRTTVGTRTMIGTGLGVIQRMKTHVGSFATSVCVVRNI